MWLVNSCILHKLNNINKYTLKWGQCILIFIYNLVKSFTNLCIYLFISHWYFPLQYDNEVVVSSFQLDIHLFIIFASFILHKATLSE